MPHPPLGPVTPARPIEGGFTFRYTYRGTFIVPRVVEMNWDQPEASIGDVLDAFTDFLRGVGYVFGRLEVVRDDE